MTETVEMHSRAAANEFRDEWPEAVTGRYDRRHKTVELVDDVGDRPRQEAAARREAPDGPGQMELSDHERDRIDFSSGRANVPWARSIKALAAEAGVDDWTSHVDPTLTVDEHREVFEEVGGGTSRGPGGDPSTIEAYLDEECDHARGACKRGNPDACEHLKTTCGLDPEHVDDLMPAVATDGGVQKVTYEDLDGSLKGALDRSWTGYQEGIRRINHLLQDLRDELRATEQAAAAIGAIEERVEDLNTDVFEVLRDQHTDLESLAEAHAGDEFHRAADVELAEREPTRPEVLPEGPDDPLREVPEEVPRYSGGRTLDTSQDPEEPPDGETSGTSSGSGWDPSQPFGVESFTFTDAVDTIRGGLQWGATVDGDELVNYAEERGIDGPADPLRAPEVREAIRSARPASTVEEAIEAEAASEPNAEELKQAVIAYAREQHE